MKTTAIMAAMVGVLAGCSTSVSNVVLESDALPVALKQAFVSVDCGDGGVAAVETSLEGAVEENLIGRGDADRPADGGAFFARTFGLMENRESAKLVVTVQPARGECVTTITDGGRGGVLFERASDGPVEATLLVQARGS